MSDAITKRERQTSRSNRDFGEDDAQRALPASQDAELGLLGSILLAPDEVLESALERGVTPGHFYVPAHARIFAVICGMAQERKPVDFISVTQVLRDLGELDKVGGPGFVTSLFTFVPTAANADYYADILKEKFVLREMIRIGTAAAARAYDGSEDPYALLEEIQSSLIEVGQAHSNQATMRDLKEGVSDAIESIEHQYEHRGHVAGISTGFVDLDRMTGGMLPGQVWMIAARPAMGKTALAMNIAENVAMGQVEGRQGALPVAVFSLEMTYNQLCMRLLCSNSPLNIKRVRDGFLCEADFPRITSAAQRLSTTPLKVDDKPGLTVFEFKARARRAVLRHGVKLIVIDYIQKMKSTSRRAQANREQEISEISDAIANTAKELGIPIIVCVQLNRDVDARKGHRPTLADMRESGSLEQDAHVVIFPFRPAYYAKDEESKSAVEEAILIIGKQRDGPTGDVPVIFQGEFARYVSATKKMYSNNDEERQRR